jgi:hypothetical protein
MEVEQSRKRFLPDISGFRTFLEQSVTQHTYGALPLAVSHEQVALWEMQMLLSGLMPAIFISLG